MPLKRAEYKDEFGRFRVVLVPEDESEENYPKGIPVGPASLAELELPEEIETRLSNELYYRGILTSEDAFRHRGDILSAIQSALKVDIERIVVAYAGKDYKNARQEPPEEQPNKSLPYRRPRRTVQ